MTGTVTGISLMAAGSRTAEPPGTSAPASVSASVEPSAGPVDASEPAVPGTGSGSPGTSASPANGRCHADQVRLAVEPAPGGGAMGSRYEYLLITNTSTRSCTLYGYPGLSFVTAPNGQQVNDPATRRSGSAPASVRLAPRQGAHVLVHTARTENYPPQMCKPVQVGGYRVYLPDETVALFVDHPIDECSVKGVNVAEVGPVEPGTQ
jgi:hypothetical protein